MKIENFYKNHKKITIVCSSIFIFLFFLFLNLKYNLPKTVEFMTNMILGTKFISSDIEFKKDKIIIKDFILRRKDEDIIIAPEVLIDIEGIIKTGRIKEISVENGESNITRYKNGDVNIVAAFTGDSKDEPPLTDAQKAEKLKNYKPGISVPIDRMVVRNFVTTYRDYAYELPIEKKLTNTNGFMTFSKTKGIKLSFSGESGNGEKNGRKVEKYTYSFDNEKEPYSMVINLQNIGVTTQLAQYGFYNENLHYLGGNLDMNLKIAFTGLDGKISFNDVTVRTDYLDENIENIDGNVIFNKEGIFLNSDFLLFGKKEKMSLSYKDDELNLNLDLKKLSRKSIVKIKGLENLSYKEAEVKDIGFNLNYKNSILTLNSDIGEIRLDNNIISGLDGNFALKDGKNTVELSVKDINNQKFLKNQKIKIELTPEENVLSFKVDSKIINFQGNYQKKEGLLKIYGKKYYFTYDMEKKYFINGNGTIGLDLFGNRLLIKYSGKDNFIDIDRVSVFNKLGITQNLVRGNIDLNNFKYKFNFLGEKFQIVDFLNPKNKYSIMDGNIKGEISGIAGKVSGNLDIRDLNLNYLANIGKINGNLIFNNKNGMELEYNGQINKIGYNGYNLFGFLVICRLKNDIFSLKSFKNRYIDINGDIDLKNEKLDILSHIRELPLKKMGVKNPAIVIKKLDMKLKGDLKNPEGKANLEDMVMQINNGVPIHLSGNMKYYNFVLSSNKIKVNNSIIKLKYNLKDKKYNSVINIIGEDIGKYYGNTALQYRVIGEIKIKGQDKKIDTSIKSTIDKIYYGGNAIPSIYLETSYKSDEIGSGTINIKKIDLYNSKLSKLLNMSGYFNIENKYLELNLDKQNVELKKLQEYLILKDLDGEINIFGKILGNIEDLRYNLHIGSGELGQKNIKFNKLKIDLAGDMKRINLKEFSFRYLKNKFYSDGYYDLKNKDYSYNIKSQKLKMSFLNAFLNKNDISNITGEASFDLKFTSGKNDGFLKISNFGLEKEDLFLKLKDFNSTILVKENKIYSKNFNGIINDGDFKFNGYLVLPKLPEIMSNPYFYENILYSADVKLSNLDYKYGDVFEIVLNSDIKLENKKLIGQVEVVKGLFRGLPTKQESIFTKIRKFLFKSTSKTINDSEELGKDFKIKTVIEDALDINLGFKIRDGIILNMESPFPLVNDVKGKIIGNGRLSGTNGKYNFLGNFEAENSSFSLNDNTFYIEKALVAFNEKRNYLPNINPSILFDAIVNVNNDKVGFHLSGTLKNLQFNISSKDGYSSGNLNSLIMGDDSVNDETNRALITNLIGGQITQIIKPVSNVIKNMFGFSKFRVTSNFSTGNNNQNSKNQENTLNFGAKLEAEHNLYKDKLWWIATGTLIQENTRNYRNEDVGMFNDYDTSIEYRFDYTKSIGIGVGKVANIQRKDDKDNEKRLKSDLNYHIDFKFEKKYDSLLDIIF